MSFVAYSSTTVSDMSSNLILSVDIWYYLSTSNTTLAGGKWTTIPPVWEENKYYWQKTVTTYNNGTTTETKPVCITGGAGQPGTGIEKMVEEYVISNSKDTAPQTGWQEVPPKWEYGKYIWSRTKIVYKNPTSTVYTTPICDSAWEAVNNIQVGGRNLYLNSKGDFVLKPRNDGTDTDNYNSYGFHVDSLQVGETYTISADVEITHGSFNKVTVLPGDTVSNTFETRHDVAIPANKRIVCTFKKTKQTTKMVLLYAGVAGSTRGNGMIVRKVKIEKGNKATDWTPAPEDVDEQFHTITESLSGVHSIVNKLDKTITDKIWQDDITTKINQYDGTVTESIRSRVTETEKNLKGVQSTVKDMETTVSKKADGSTVETLNTRLTKAEQDATGFKTTVQNYFTTTDKTLNGIQSWKTEVNQKISKDGILSTVGDYYATQDDLNNLNIGGSNLINKTDVQPNSTSMTISGYNFDISGTCSTTAGYDGISIPDTIFQKDEFYVFSYKFTIKSGSVTKIGGHQAAFKTIKAVVDGIEYKTEYDSGYPLDSKKTEHTVTVYLKYLGNGTDKKLYIQPNCQGGPDTSWNILLKEVQVRRGNTKTDWQPSIKDSLSSVQIGGRNLIVNSTFNRQDYKWIGTDRSAMSYPKEGRDGSYCAKITGKFNTSYNLTPDVTYKVKPGETYTLSGWTKSKDIVKGTTNYFVSLYLGFYDKDHKWKAEAAINDGQMPLSSEWERNVLTCTVPDVSGIDHMWVYLYARDFTGTLWWDDFKLEKGNKATDWTPAPEDIYDDINSIKTGSRNFLRNGNFAKTTTMSNSSKHPNLYPWGWGGYNSGISNPETSWHAHIDNTTFGFNVVEFNESDGNRNWKGICVRKQTDFLFVEKLEEEYCFSVDVYATGVGTKLTGGFFYYKKGGTTQAFHSGYYTIRPETTNKWVRMSAIVPLKDDIDFSKDFSFYIYGYGFDANAILYIKDVALTTGNKTADWTPAPEETNMQIANVETIANQTKDKFTWIVKSGTSATNFELTDRTATLVANTINLKGLVTFSGLNNDAQNKINTAQSTANTAKSAADTITSIVNNNKSNWDKGYNWTNTNGGNMSKMLDMVKTWTDGALTTTTTINGGYIRTNTINAAHLTLGDFTNLVDVNESLPQSAVPDSTHPFGPHAKPMCKNGYWYKESAASEYLALSSYKPNSFADGDELYYEFTAHSESAGNYFIALWFYNGTPKEYQAMLRGNIESVTTSDKTFSGIIKLEDAKKYDFFAIGIADNNNTKAQIYAKNISVRKKTNATLIVDGAILGRHIAANTIDASKIQIGNLNNICVVNPDTYNPYGLAVIESHGQKYFRLGANTDSSTPRYISLPLRRNISSNTYYPVGDCWKFRAYGYQTVAGVAYTFCIRVLYTDGNNTNLGTCRLDPPAYNPGYFEGVCQITAKPIAGKPISHFEIFIETGHQKSHYLYLRDITIYSMTNTTLLEDGCVTTSKITTNNIVGANGWINLRSGTFNYGNGKFAWNGSTLTVNGSGSFSGTITSSAGSIGGWSINGSSIYRGNGYNVAGGMYFGTSGLSISNKFRVDANGNVTMSGATMTGANVSGTITSSAGSIGGWSINGSSIYRGSADYNATTGMYFGTSGLRLGSAFKVNSNGYATINGGTFTGTINAETGKISGWRLLSSRLVSLDVDVQNETDFKNKGTKAVYLAKYNYNSQGSISAIGVQTRTSTSNAWVNRIDIRYDGSMIFKNQNDVIVTKFDNGNWSDIGTISCNDVIIKQNSKSYKLSHRMLVCDDTANVLGVGMTTSGDRFIPMKDKKADYAHGKISIGSNQNRFSEVWSVKALNTTSDRNLKTNISSFDERYENFFMDLNTCTFMYKNFTYDDTHDRLHWGVDAQQAEQALIKNHITLGEAGFLCIDHLEYPNAAGQMKEYSVRYSELIGLNVHMTQKSHVRIKELEKQNQELEKRIAVLEARLN